MKKNYVWNLKKCTEKRETGITRENKKKLKLKNKNKKEWESVRKNKKRGKMRQIKLEWEGKKSWYSWGVFLSKLNHFGGY